MLKVHVEEAIFRGDLEGTFKRALFRGRYLGAISVASVASASPPDPPSLSLRHKSNRLRSLVSDTTHTVFNRPPTLATAGAGAGAARAGTHHSRLVGAVALVELQQGRIRRRRRAQLHVHLARRRRPLANEARQTAVPDPHQQVLHPLRVTPLSRRPGPLFSTLCLDPLFSTLDRPDRPADPARPGRPPSSLDSVFRAWPNHSRAWPAVLPSAYALP